MGHNGVTLQVLLEISQVKIQDVRSGPFSALFGTETVALSAKGVHI